MEPSYSCRIDGAPDFSAMDSHSVSWQTDVMSHLVKVSSRELVYEQILR
jgi:hypothetical protein